MKKSNLIALVIICLFEMLSVVEVSAQKIEAISLFETTDLPTTDISRVRQDKQGFIWFVSEDGLYRFDGYKYEHHAFIDQNPDFPLRRIKKFEFDNFGRIWLDTKDNRLYCYTIETKELQEIHFKKDKIFSEVNSMTLCEDKLFIGHNTPHYFSLKNIDLEDIKPIKISNVRNTRLGYYRKNFVWFVMSSHMIMFDAKKEKLLRTIKVPANATSITVDAANNVWIGDNSKKIYVYNTKKDQWTTIKTLVNGIKWMEYDELRNKILVTSFTNIYEIDLDLDKVVLDRIPLHKTIQNGRETFIDKQNNAWLVVSNNDLIKLNYGDHDAYNLNFKQVYSEKSKKFIFQDFTGAKWLAGTSGLTRKNFETKEVKEYLPKIDIKSVQKYNDSLFYVFTRREGYEFKYNEQKKDFNVVKIVSKDQIGLRYLNTGIRTKENLFWIGNHKGVARVNIQENTSEFLPVLKWSNVNYLVYDEEHNAILASAINKGIFQFNLDENHQVIDVKNINRSKKLGSNTVQSIYLGKNNVWAATSRGLSKLGYDKNKKEYFVKKNYTTKDGLSHNYVSTVLAENNRFLWIGTNLGLNRLDVKNQKITSYYKGFGDAANKIVNCYSTYAQDKRMYFGVSKGFIKFNPKNLHKSLYTYSMYVEDVEINGVNGKSIKDLKDLKHYENYIILTVSVPNYNSPNGVKYRYRLDNKKWTESPARHSTFAIDNISHGNHSLQLQCSNEDGVWNSEIKKIDIYMTPPFWKSWWFVSVLVLLVVLIIRFLLIRFRLKKEFDIQLGIEKKLRETDQEKIKFFTDVSHDLKTPLTMISRPIEKMLGQEISEEEKKYLLETASKNTNRLINLINQVLNFSTIQSGDLTLNIQRIELISFLNNIIDSFNFETSQKQINLILKTELQELIVFFDKEKIERVLYNLLSNAFKNTPKNGNITLGVVFDDTTKIVDICVEDTGFGIRKDKLNRIFKRFYQTDTKNVGQGIGLSIVKEYIEAHDGSVNVESEYNKGTKICIALPVEEENAKQKEKNKEKNVVKEDKEHSILLVEDDNDLREYIVYELQPFYKIYTANNGKIGQEMAIDKKPDLILTDLKMPDMNGAELCDVLKGDLRTSHIPVIVITAFSGMELESLAIGANDYISKPLNVDSLLLKIKNHLKLLEQAKEKFDREISLTPKAENKETPQKIFINKIMEVIEEEFIDKKLDIELLTQRMNMSKSVLYKKVLDYTGQSVNELITTVKIKKAEEFLLNSDYSFNEITYLLGYNDSKYFRGLFKKKNGLTPLQFKKNKLREQ
ncbi:hybrid sensor histidine kinase/response regulator transcription factor [Wenyingzhuangia aestuarii]|uniref:hybrid sensor histidine kinase/response regulator transcription factor n=1 Tax=Wenyingzhuangia aestuarii TaxID=1647582 RepID=UPI001439E52E|nr:ATP-binding protein [Wenyingzhuangia aestuarii]NJB83542.1 signal transduction histidine kinase/DNA-binding response OmpR family regulator/ligand-binding sensor domain-containing protein [Wenyingzhuangia aestuarii]